MVQDIIYPACQNAEKQLYMSGRSGFSLNRWICIVKNTLLRTAFPAILPGLVLALSCLFYELLLSFLFTFVYLWNKIANKYALGAVFEDRSMAMAAFDIIYNLNIQQYQVFKTISSFQNT